MASALDWDEFRLIKAIADARSLVGAAEALNLNHSTVFRRLAAIENDVGARLFERSRAGYQPTEAGEEMIALASSMAESILEFERRVAGRDAKPSGELRVTAVDSVAIGLLAPILARFRAANPGVQVDLIIAEQTLNLSRRDADVAIRGANDPPEVAGRPSHLHDPLGGLLHAGDRRTNTAGGWSRRRRGSGSARRRRAPSAGPTRRSARGGRSARSTRCWRWRRWPPRGSARRCCPASSATNSRDLVRIGGIVPELDVDLWLLTHADLRHSARVRAFIDFAGAELSYARDLIEGVAAVEAA